MRDKQRAFPLGDEYIPDTDLKMRTEGGFPMIVIYVDDERPALECFEYEARELKEITQLNVFDRGEEALRLAWERAGQPVGELAARILESRREDASDDATVAVVRLSHIPST